MAWRVALLSVIAGAGVLIGLWAAPKTVTGCTGFGTSYRCNTSDFPSWFWPATCIVGLSLIWSYAAWILLIRPIRSGELRHGADRNHPDSSTTSADSRAAGRTTTCSMNAAGWYKDPFQAHEARWFSDGKPTFLVRDGAVESHDEPPETELDLPLVPVSESNSEDAADLLRADSNGSTGAPGDGAFQAFGSSGGSFT